MKQTMLHRIGKWRLAAGIVLSATVIVELFITLYAHFGIDGVFAFHALYGFFVCIALVIIARVLGVLIRRRDDYYDV